MNSSQEITGDLICSLASKNTYLVVNSVRSLNLTKKEDETHYIQMQSLTNHGIL